MTARIRVRVTPRAGRDAIDAWDGDVLRVRVSPPAADGRANDALLRLIARELDLPRSKVRFASGEHARIKLLEIEGLSLDDVRDRLASHAIKPT